MVTTWARGNPNYATQRYALAVTLEGQELQQVDLHQLLQAQLQLRLRVQP